MTDRIQQFDYATDLLEALLWQYNDATRLQSLLQSKAAWYAANHSSFWSDWLRDVFDLSTANDFGLCVWAIILGLPLAALPSDDPNKPIWGFGADVTYDYSGHENFNNGNFPNTNNVPFLGLEDKRKALQLRYFQLVTNGSVTEANQIVQYVFGPGAVSVWTSYPYAMKIRYGFESAITPELATVLTQYDLLPRPAGVGADFIIHQFGLPWGFDTSHENFNNGNFYA